MHHTRERKGNKARSLRFLGTHLLLELKDCDPKILNNLDKVRNAMDFAAKKAKATIVDVSFHEFNPFGISGMVVMAKSHLSIHTWPEYNYAAVDIFTCGKLIKPKVAANCLVRKLKSKDHSSKKIRRGVLLPEGTLKHKPDTVCVYRGQI